MSFQTVQTIQPKVSRQISRRVVFEFLLKKGPLSRASLAKQAGLSKQTVSEIMDDFLAHGLVQQVGHSHGNIGRKAVLYELASGGGYVIGVDLGGTKVSAIIANISARILGEITEATHESGGQMVLDQVVRMANTLAQRAGIHLSQLKTIVLGTPGVISPSTGQIKLAPNIIGVGQMDVLEYLRQHFNSTLRIEIENDVNLALLGEAWQGCAHGIANVAFIALGTGIGLGLMANGQLIRGASGAAGEIGFLPLGPDPFSETSLKHGSLEYEIGARGIVRRYIENGGETNVSARDIIDRFAQGEASAVEVIGDTARMLGFALASVKGLFDPELMVLGGSIGARSEFLAKVQETFQAITPIPFAIKASALGNRAGVLGALAVALNHLHEDTFGIDDLPGDLPLPSPHK